MTKSLLLLAAVLVSASSAAAHVTVTATGPEEVQVGVPFTIEAEVRANCAVVVAEYQAMGETELFFGLPPDHPAYFVNHTGAPFAWTAEQCSLDPAEQGNAVGVGSMTLEVTAAAPAFTVLNLSVVSYGNDPAVPEGGDPAIVPIRVAYHAVGALAAAKAGHDVAHGDDGNHTGQAIELILNYTTNAESLLTVEAVSSAGEVHAIDAVAVTPPSFDNKSRSEVELLAHFQPPAEWSTADLTFNAFLTPVAGGAKVPVGTATLSLANDAAETHDEHSDEEHEHAEDKESPAPVFAFVGLGLLAFAAIRRR